MSFNISFTNGTHLFEESYTQDHTVPTPPTIHHIVLASAVSIPKPVPLPHLLEGEVDFSKIAPKEDIKCLQDVLHRFRARIEQRRILMKPIFQDFDRYCIYNVIVLLMVCFVCIFVVFCYYFPLKNQITIILLKMDYFIQKIYLISTYANI